MVGRAPVRGRRRVRLARSAAAAVVVAGLLAGAVTGLWSAAGRSVLYATGIYRDGGAPTVPPGWFDTGRPTPLAAGSTAPHPSATPVLPAARTGRAPGAAALADRLADLPAAGIGTAGYAVGDPATGAVVTSRHGDTAMIPASSMKLLTGLAALDAYGPEHRFSTTVVSAGARSVVLVGGGDPYLATKRRSSTYPARASLDELADQVADRLADQLANARTHTVTVDWDVSRFSGPAWNATWPDKYADQVTPTSALWVEEGRTAGSSGPRVSDPARAAARAFVAALDQRKVRARLGQPDRAASGAPVLARVRSMPLAQIVEQSLLHSDNDAAEVLFRQVPVAEGRAGSIAQARTAVQRRLVRLGVWAAPTVVHDGSGLSRADRIPPRTFLGVLRLGMSQQTPQFRALVTGLPVAGSDGSLRYRFFADGTASARGDVHAKTGTLTGVHALVGYATTADHATVTFAFVVNAATSDYLARIWLDRAAATVAHCGC